METSKKEFDCVEFQRIAGARIHEELVGKTAEERLDYWKRMNEDFLARHPQMRQLPIATDRQ